MDGMTTIIMGYLILLFGAVCGGSFGLPSKFVPKDVSWETLWGLFFFCATLLLPLVFGPIILPKIFAIYQIAGLSSILFPFLFGILWGLGSMTLGLSFAFIGLSLAYAINYGGQIIFGTIAPMAVFHPEAFQKTSGMIIVGGVVFCIFGVIVSGFAGVLKSNAQEKNLPANKGDSEKAKKNPLPGLILALLSGALCACWSLGFAFGQPILDVTAAEPFGITNADWRNSFPLTCLMLWGGCLSSCLYCVYKLYVNKTWSSFKRKDIVLIALIALLMALLHDGAVLLFGIGALKLGVLGGSVGYAVFMSFSIIAGNVNGFLTGEWKNAGNKAVCAICAGLGILVLSVCVLGYGNYRASLEAKEKCSTPSTVEQNSNSDKNSNSTPISDPQSSDQPTTDNSNTGSSNAESVNIEPTSTESTNTEPANTEPASTESTNTEPANTEPASTESVNTETTNTEPKTTENPVDSVEDDIK